MNTTEINSPLTPIQALHRCLEWFDRHEPEALLPGTHNSAVIELHRVIAADELRNDPTENAKLREVLEIARRYALVEYSESAACRVIASEIQKVFPANGEETQTTTP